MTQHNLTPEQEQHVESHAPYMTVFFILLNYTAMEYIYAKYYEAGRTLPIYLIGVALVLTIITAVVARVWNMHFNRRWVYLTMIPAVLLPLSPLPLIPGLMILAVTKATLVGLWFMHLKFEGNWVYYMLIPAAILAMVFIVALYPDMAMQPSEAEQAAQGEELSEVVRPLSMLEASWS